MLSMLFGRKSTSTSQIDNELMWEIVLDFRRRFPEAKPRWEVVHLYGQQYGGEVVRNTLDEAIRINELVEDENGIYFNPMND